MGSFFAFSGEIAFFVRISSAWQLYGLYEKSVRLDISLTIQGKLPSATQIDFDRLCLCVK